MQKSTLPKYLWLAEKLEKEIVKGTFEAGDKLPSLRTIKSEYRVSISTAFETYLYLIDKGLIESTPKTGYFVKPYKSHLETETATYKTNHIVKPTTVKRFDIIKEIYLEENNKRVSFSVAAPGQHLLPVNPLLKMMNKTVNSQGSSLLAYGSITGYLPLKNEISKKSFRSNISVKADDIIITSGCLEAIQIALRSVTKPGDTIAIESPCYYGFLQLAEMLELKVAEIPSSPVCGINTEMLEKTCKQISIKAILICSNFSNPTGALMSDEEKRKILYLAEKHRIPVIEDDVYGDLFYYGQRPAAIKSFDKNGWCIYCSSFSKSLSPGTRVGWMIAGRFKEKAEKLKYITNMTSAIHPQAVIARFLNSGGYDQHLKKLRTQAIKQINLIRHTVLTHFPSGTKITSPQGGYTLWVELPNKLNADELYKKALDKNITFLPGKLFSTGNKFNHFLRLSCGSEISSKHIKAIQEMGRILYKE